ncbi:30S ribosomal protein S13 [Candidatus Fokinia solitaria]|uniref:Small ribosomal subunit protein uS13 n=1 Tax=Candidatus Fokinia solitaria TaxID=1802984 RepID=A0A2U8BRL4_9RICK|nr:30S ribosomal protein S13 [Candidatus Fokinia solitaria]AWD32981.1 30S ribosomal protein S13 [Candidatus Fokinia solitaria]
MSRIVGVDIPSGKKLFIALTYIYGIGLYRAREICKAAGIDGEMRVSSMTEDQLAKIGKYVSEYEVEGMLKARVGTSIKRLIEINCYRGLRHLRKLPLRGQRTRTNARTKKGKRVPIAGKKMATK